MNIDNIKIKSFKKIQRKEWTESISWFIELENIKTKQSIILEYSEGIGHFINIFNENEYTKDAEKFLLNLDYHIFKLNYYIIEFAKLFDKEKIVKNPKLSFSYEILPPKVSELLFSLAIDAQAHNETFEDWCANYGYDMDSIKAKKIYDKCNESYFKLQKLGFDNAKIEQLSIEEEE